MNIRSLTITAAAVLALAGAMPAVAQTAAKAPAPVNAQPGAKAQPPMTPEAEAVRKLVEQRVPGMEVRGITKTDIAGGLYEVLVDDRIVYVDPKVNYLFMGSIYDLSSKQNLTDDRYFGYAIRATPTLAPSVISDPRTYGAGVRYQF